MLVTLPLKHRAFKGSFQSPSWLMSALANHGFHDVRYFNMEKPGFSLDDLLDACVQADFIGLCGVFSMQLDQAVELASAIKNRLKTFGRESVPVVLGGYGAAEVDRLAAFTPQIDAFFFGPGTDGIVQIATAVKAGRFRQALKSREIHGLSYYDFSLKRFVRGRASVLPTPEELASIDQLYCREHVSGLYDMGDIFFDGQGKALKTFQLVTELGCPYECTFCSESGGISDRMFSREDIKTRGRVVEVPLESVFKTFEKAALEGYKAVYLDIETAFRNWARLEKILDCAKAHEIKVGLNTRIDTVTEERIRRCAELGVVYQFYGVEHLNPQVLLAIDKFPHTDISKRIAAAEDYPSKVYETFRLLNAYGIQSSLFIILGLPKICDEDWVKLRNGELEFGKVHYAPTTLEDDLETIELAFENCRPKHFNANVLRLNPDTSQAWDPRFECIRPSGAQALDAVWFVPDVKRKLNLPAQEMHPVYLAFESLESNQPYSTAMTPERAFKTFQVIIRKANEFGTHVYVDESVLAAGILTRDGSMKQYDLHAESLADFKEKMLGYEQSKRFRP